ncbi:RDD family protein [Nesterenkonia populi]|uniref:RDD family protein n=1 Tax=Nesterenkonia populi TaxID=1591087 RepID=UPI001479184B|nr:RDD family protein [Nesterenkonia populi]
MRRSVLTSEAVSLDLPAVSLITRGATLLLDLFVYGLLLLAMMLLLGAFGAPAAANEAAAAAVMTATVIFCLVVVPVAVETLSRGRSPGKWVFGVRVVRDDGGSIRFRHALLRGLVLILELFTMGMLSVVCALVTRRGKRFGDLVAGTYGVASRHPRMRPMMLPVPPMMSSWTQVADIGRLPEDLAVQTGRLLRTVEQSGRARNMRALEAVAEELAAEVRQYVSPQPPASSPFELLAAVMAERRNREYQRLVSAQHRQQRLLSRLAGA